MPRFQFSNYRPIDFEQEFHLDKYIKFNHEVAKAEWKEGEGIYNVDIKNANGEIVHDWCHVLINAAGILNSWKCESPFPIPAVETIMTFQKGLRSREWTSSRVVCFIRLLGMTKLTLTGNGLL